MIEIQLSTATRTIVTFHANTVEFFYATSSAGGKSFHVGHIRSFELVTDRNGKNVLSLNTEQHVLNHDVEDNNVARIKELIVEVQRAMKTVSL
jgi:hypothetical protein